MLREFTQIVDAEISKGFDRGVNLFMENLSQDLEKMQVIEEAGGIDAYLTKHLGITDDVNIDEDLENIDESKLDELIDKIIKD